MIKNINGRLKKINTDTTPLFFKTPAQVLRKKTGEASGIDLLGEELALRAALKNYVKKSLGEELARHVTYCSIKNNTLFIVLNHISALSLYRLKEKELLDNLRKWYRDLKKEAPKAYWTRVKVQLENDFKIFSKKPPLIEENTFEEVSSGEFEIECQDPKLRESFERIRKSIKANINKNHDKSPESTNGSEVVVMGELGIFED
ncbi:hypothetical protein BKH41_02735 [Helicobacter sp. 12S02232-10]|uniref:DciA family protein n=1 Tax=Helicobacter sp. 12S02232-10 TaxID=1476197 RepID=UPI000BA5A21A|nr:DciA family protein [Helicobacter sp. 12S02232-10]PAF49598.1 hypothetical protein BKH41_02735 [Helicobacter sp. 12S02232-10]